LTLLQHGEHDMFLHRLPNSLAIKSYTDSDAADYNIQKTR